MRDTTDWRAMGAKQIRERVNAGLSIADCLQAGCDAATSGTMPGLLEGMVETSLDIVRAVDGKGVVRFTGAAQRLLADDFPIGLNLKFARREASAVGADLGILAAAVFGAAQVVAKRGGRVVVKEEAKPAAPQEQTPTLVRVVGMPDRRTQTAIVRDENGDIISSQQIERDDIVEAV